MSTDGESDASSAIVESKRTGLEEDRNRSDEQLAKAMRESTDEKHRRQKNVKDLKEKEELHIRESSRQSFEDSGSHYSKYPHEKQDESSNASPPPRSKAPALRTPGSSGPRARRCSIASSTVSLSSSTVSRAEGSSSCASYSFEARPSFAISAS